MADTRSIPVPSPRSRTSPSQKKNDLRPIGATIRVFPRSLEKCDIIAGSERGTVRVAE
ncbi:hypothetical protein HPP92_010400 [Vanilla planifolia]|uniref:Uncharacterized protein n=1 Tax=Vanilla planifolia TaxID=51239 RepID=A0A835QYT9_VANPL|nr:hypothetical protein HPP92_010692 [Vanilla planifolia]KAG0482316.1 hypothetical protein HPP92_010400 [Vanilla planifolia]